MDDIVEAVTAAAKQLGEPFELIPIDPTLSDTAAFCSTYGFSPAVTANTLLVASKSTPKKYCACVVLATTHLDVNHAVKNLMDCRVSFAKAEEMTALTGMEVGAVTPFGVNPDVPIFVDERVLEPEWIILGAGKRALKIKISPQALLKLPNVTVVAELAIAKAASPL